MNQNVENRKTLSLRLDRSSVCAGDDVESHETILQVSSDELLEVTLDRILNAHYLPAISGGRATWILESGKPFARSMCCLSNKSIVFQTEHQKPLAVVAQQWKGPKFLMPAHSPIGVVTEPEKGLYLNYWNQVDPEVVFECLQKGRSLPDRYGRSQAPKN